MPPLSRTETDPYRNFVFKVEIDGITQAGFNEASGFDSTSDVIDYREGNEVTTARRIPGLVKYGDIVLKWGLTDSRELWDWRQRIIDGEIERKNVSIVVLDTNGEEKIRWQCVRAWPSNMDPTDFTAKGNDVAVMSLKLSHEGVRQQP
jgi:phage tail-like protein